MWAGRASGPVEHPAGQRGQLTSTTSCRVLPLFERFGAADVTLSGAGGQGRVLCHRGGDRWRRWYPVLGLVGGDEFGELAGDGTTPGREHLDQLVVDPVDLAQPVGPCTPGDAEPAGQLCLEHPVVQRSRAGACREQTSAIECPPAAVLDGAGPVEDQTVGVQLHVAVTRGPLVHPRHDKPVGLEHPHAVASRTHEAGRGWLGRALARCGAGR